MNWKRLTAVALAALLLVSGTAAAAPGNAPDNAGADDESENGDAGPPGEIGPPGGLPGPVPDFVSDLLDRIVQGVDGLGPAIGDIVPSGGGSAPPS